LDSARVGGTGRGEMDPLRSGGMGRGDVEPSVFRGEVGGGLEEVGSGGKPMTREGRGEAMLGEWPWEDNGGTGRGEMEPLRSGVAGEEGLGEGEAKDGEGAGEGVGRCEGDGTVRLGEGWPYRGVGGRVGGGPFGITIDGLDTRLGLAGMTELAASVVGGGAELGKTKFRGGVGRLAPGSEVAWLEPSGEGVLDAPGGIGGSFLLGAPMESVR